MSRPDRAEVLREIERGLFALDVPQRAISEATPLFEGGLELDSFAVVELLGRLEERFEIAFHDDDFTPERFSVGGLLSLVEARLGSQA